MIERIQAEKFKSKCLMLLDKVQRTKKKIIITKRNKPIAQLIPVEEEVRSLFGRMKGIIRVVGDILSPIDENWDSSR